ncbi:LAME_0E01860g1_1 [Lachancea meyersii CBS 8951]|uniref:LAME_0E01860g1_1 n=1 Tax=Lachancea meyersii CBS 8951 TaxID=1266667 RepID=A0A1G4JG75_9SACH|nr:LAME_0E01860g1_1 [Lachancea meyersii CBS 8951]
MSSSSDNDSTPPAASGNSENPSAQNINREVLKEANELLESLEHSHRNDLALHLYSTYLLKTVLKAANRKKFALETHTLIKTQIKDNWTSWPNPSTVIDPKIDTIFEDVNGTRATVPKPLKPGELSPEALLHGSKMLQGELDAVWQQSLTKMASDGGITLDIDKMNISEGVSTAIMQKIDHFFKGVHASVASTNKLKIAQTSGSSQLKISEHQPNGKPLDMNRKIKLDYRDIIMRGCQMGEEMDDVYMKGLELFGDIPSKYRSEDFKLSKKELTKYSARLRASNQDRELHLKSGTGYISAEQLLHQNILPFEKKIKLRSILYKHRDRSLDEKAYLHLESFAKAKLLGMGQDNDYGINDCVVPIRRSRSRYVSKKLR